MTAEATILPFANTTAWGASANEALVESWTPSLHGKAPGTVRNYLDEVWRFAQAGRA